MDETTQEKVEQLAERDNGKQITVSKTWYWNWDDSLFNFIKKIFSKEE